MPGIFAPEGEPLFGDSRIPDAQLQHFQALRKFLIGKGYHLQAEGAMGPQLRSALKNWQAGVGVRNPNVWNRVHQPMQPVDLAPGYHLLPVADNAPHPAALHQQQAKTDKTAAEPKQVDPKNTSGLKNLPTHNTPSNSPHGTSFGGNGGGSNMGMAGFSTLLLGMLGQAGTQKMLPTSLADMAAGPDTALANTLQQQLGQLPDAKAQALANISNWFGQVQGAQKNASAQDAAAATAGANAMVDNTKGIMASLGGSAMPGNAEVGAVGANDANTMQAIAANNSDLAAQLAPIFKLSEAGAKSGTSARFDQTQQDLTNQLGQAQGQGEADKANALMAILSANNQSRQSNFGNKAGLLNTLASLQISGQNAASMAQYRQLEGMLGAQRVSISAQRAAQAAGKTGYAGASATDKNKAFNQIVSAISSGGKLTGGLSWPAALQRAQDIVHGFGWNPYNPAVVGGLLKPALTSVGVNFTDPTAYNG